MLERLARGKHSSLLQKSVNYGCKKFYSTGPCLLNCVVGDDGKKTGVIIFISPSPESVAFSKLKNGAPRLLQKPANFFRRLSDGIRRHQPERLFGGFEERNQQRDSAEV
jgi:hypothetical protein